MPLPHLADARSIAVHADELEEKGDPRAALIRAQAAGQSGEALVSQHWSEWVGGLAPEATLLRWELGYLIEASLGAAPPEWLLSDLLTRPTARFLRRLTVGGRAQMSLAGIEQLASLRELVWFTQSPARQPPLTGGLETLSLDLEGNVTVQELTSLSAARLPRLTTLHTRCLAPSEAALFTAFAKARWWSTLTRWTHRVRSLEGLLALRACGPLLVRGGRGLIALCDQAVLGQVPDELRRALPHAEFALRPLPTQPHDPDDSHGEAEFSVTPVSAPMNFRSLPPRTQHTKPSVQNTGDTDSTSVGSGVPCTALNWDRRHFTRCGWCYAADTRCIWEQEWSSYSHFETSRYSRWEYECPSCGLFTHSRCSHTS